MRTKLVRLALGAALFSVTLLSAPAGAAVVVRVGPPPVRVEVRPAAPSARHVWTAGYWSWNGKAHVWVGGAWVVPPRAKTVWVDGHWKKSGGGWVWVPGHWR